MKPGAACLLLVSTTAAVFANAGIPTTPFNYTVFDLTDRLNWTQAQAYCQSAGGSLPIILSEAENHAAFTALDTRKCFLGLSDMESEGNFQWIDGSPLSYTNWLSGEPNNNDDTEDCAFMWEDGMWNDAGCFIPMDVVMCQFGTRTPSAAPTISPSESPSRSPTIQPSRSPTLSPSTTKPSRTPSSTPTQSPSSASLAPSSSPAKLTGSPTVSSAVSVPFSLCVLLVMTVCELMILSW